MKIQMMFIVIFITIGIQTGFAQEPEFESSKLNSQQLENLAAFAKMYGYIRHFQPVAQFDSVNWESFIIKEGEFILSAKNNEELQSRLDSVCLELGKDIWVCNKNMCATRTVVHNNFIRSLKSKSKFTLYQLQEGWGNRGVNATISEVIYKRRIISSPFGMSLPSNILKPEDFIRLPLTRELELCLPLTLYADELGSLSHPHAYPKFNISPKQFSSSKRWVRMGSVMIAWNVIQHYYPYLKVMKIDWDQALPEYIQRAANCKSEDEFKKVLQEFTVEYKDAHAWVYQVQERELQPYFSPPVQIDYIEDHAIVTFSDLDTSTLKDGDEIISIDRIPVKKYIDERMKLVSGATQQYIHYSTMNELLCGRKNSDVVLEIKLKDKKTSFVTIKRSHDQYMNRLRERRPNPYFEIDKDLVYADLTRLNDSTINLISSKLFGAKGIIFDMRGYPANYFLRDSLPCYLSENVVQGASFNTPVYYYPDQNKIVTYVKQVWERNPAPQRITKNIFILIDGSAVSASEAFLSLYANNNLVTFIGEPTAGTNGNVNKMNLFGLFTISFTGMEILNQDGSQFHGVGIRPDIAVKKTAKAMMEKRQTRSGYSLDFDETLVNAIEHCRKERK